MITPLISYIDTKAPSRIFTGRNALYHAVYWITYGSICADDSNLFALKDVRRTRLTKSVCWGTEPALTALQSSDSVLGSGVHAKMYELGDCFILSSQNNGSSPLFEFAVVYKPASSSKLRTFLGKSIWQARRFSEWFQKNKEMPIRFGGK